MRQRMHDFDAMMLRRRHVREQYEPVVYVGQTVASREVARMWMVWLALHGVAYEMVPRSIVRMLELRQRTGAILKVSVNRWTAGLTTGISSITIWSVMTGRPHGLAGFGPDVPHDPADFGRCHRLLQAFPEWRVRLGEVVVRYPAWGPMIREWDRMTALYEREIQRQDGMAPELYELMQSLQDVARETASR